MPLTEGDSLPTGRKALVHYLIVRREPTGVEAPHTFFRCGERVLPVFCAREAARRFIASRAPGEGWYARGFSGGELISLVRPPRERRVGHVQPLAETPAHRRCPVSPDQQGRLHSIPDRNLREAVLTERALQDLLQPGRPLVGETVCHGRVAGQLAHEELVVLVDVRLEVVVDS